MLPTTPDDDRVAVAPGADGPAVFRADLDRALAAMPPRRRACVVLVWCLDVSPVDAAEALSIAPGTVRKQLELARAYLHQHVVET
jgi:DNA-directed RNA polymerase specialized sigma24 family protein